MTAKARFLQDDVARAVRGCLAAGLSVGTVRVLPDGEIRVYAADDPLIPGASRDGPLANPLDRLLLDHGPAQQ